MYIQLERKNTSRESNKNFVQPVRLVWESETFSQYVFAPDQTETRNLIQRVDKRVEEKVGISPENKGVIKVKIYNEIALQ